MARRELIERAQNGEGLETWERRMAVEFLDDTTHKSTREIASIFGVTPRCIQKDREHIKRERSRHFQMLGPMDLVTDFVRTQNWSLNKLRFMVEEGTLSPDEKIKALKEISMISKGILSAMQSLGAMPKQLGSVHVVEEKWTAEVAASGQVMMKNKNIQMPLEDYSNHITKALMPHEDYEEEE